MNKQKNTPLYNALTQHASVNPISFHVPGHKYGIVFQTQAREYYRDLLRLDVTELSGLDDLHHPESIIAEAQQLAAELYGVEETFFLVNGSTVGNLAMIFATCEEHKKVIVQRNCHKSVIHALHLVGASPVFLSPEFDETVRVASYVSFATVKKAIEEHPDATAVILTNPNYYGMSVHLAEIIKIAHSRGIPVLVDEAHGAHFVAGPPFPTSAIAYGADIVVQSAHKTLPAMTMGSYLHVNSSLVDKEKLRYFLQVFQSSSPSYPIMASLDLARSYVANVALEDIQHIQAQIEQLKEKINESEGVTVVHSNDPLVTTDLLKITVQTKSECSGYELQQRLEQQGIFPELADPFNVLLVYPLAPVKDLPAIIEKMKRAFKGMHDDARTMAFVPYSFMDASPSISYRVLAKLPKKVVLLEKAEGLVAAEMIIPYPPGIPLLCMGEVIRKEHIEQIVALKQYGARFQGGTYLSSYQIEVVEQ